MQNSSKQLWIVAGIIVIPIIGYGIMELLFHVLPLSEETMGTHFLVTLIIIALGLAIPYWMFKLGFKKAHLRDSREQEVTLADIPEDKDEISRHKGREGLAK